MQTSPSLFDGVIAGAPAFKLYAHIGFFGYVYERLGVDVSNVTLAQWSAVQAQVLERCDSLDGAKDGILEAPANCKLDWTQLVCDEDNDEDGHTNGNATTSIPSTCLTSDQVEKVSALFAPILYNETLIHPGAHHSFEPVLIATIYSDLVKTWLPEVFRYIVYSDIKWDPTTFTLSDVLYALQTQAGGLSSFSVNISAFRDAGGKMLHWHGLAD